MRKDSRPGPGARNGFTLIEVLVVIAILGVLSGLTLQGINAARQSARRAQCGNQLRQLGLAVNQYISVHGAYPPANGAANGLDFKKHYSLFSQILGQLDQFALYNSINFDVPLNDFHVRGFPEQGLGANQTALSTSLSVLLCPADGGWGDGGRGGNTNYRVNLGTSGGPRPPTRRAGAFSGYDPVRPASIRDGLNQTAAFSEKLRGTLGNASYRSNRSALHPQFLTPSLDESLELCRFQESSTPPHFAAVGLTWMIGTLSQTCYNHLLVPNSQRPDCVLFAIEPVAGAMPPRSLHPGGVQCGFLDGSVRFVRESISLPTWQAFGTRSGGEVVEITP